MSALLTQDQCPQCKADQSAFQMMGAQPSFCLQCKFPLMLIAGKYPLEQVLSYSGQSTLYLAKHHRLKRKAERVIKVLSQEHLNTNEAIKRFHREVQVTAELSQINEHIVRIYDDFGEVPYLGYYYVMEYLQGAQLDEYLDQQPTTLPPAWGIDIMMQLCDALQVAHEAGVIHRDIKPQNLMLLERPSNPIFLKVLDWGIAKTSVGGPLTQALTQQAIGTPLYMAPEQVFNEPIDARTDIYSMGILFFELLTGSNPFAMNLDLPEGAEANTEHSMAMALNAQMNHLPSSLKELLPRTETRPLLQQIVTKAMAKEPDQRYNDVDELLSALRGVANAMQFQLPSDSAIELDAPFASGLDMPIQTPHSLDFLDATGRPNQTRALPTEAKHSIHEPLQPLHSLASYPEGHKQNKGSHLVLGNESPLPTEQLSMLDDELSDESGDEPAKRPPLPTPHTGHHDPALPNELVAEAQKPQRNQRLELAQTTVDPIGRSTRLAIEEAYPQRKKPGLFLWLSAALLLGALVGFFWWSSFPPQQQTPTTLASGANKTPLGSQTPAARTQDTTPQIKRPIATTDPQGNSPLPRRTTPDSTPTLPTPQAPKKRVLPARPRLALARPKKPRRRPTYRRKVRRKARRRAPKPPRRPKVATATPCHKGWRWVSVRPFLHNKSEVLTEGGKSRKRTSSGICVSTSTWRMSVMQQGYALCIFKPKKQGTLHIRLKPEDGLHSPNYCIRQ